jgi:hypothetical protein
LTKTEGSGPSQAAIPRRPATTDIFIFALLFLIALLDYSGARTDQKRMQGSFSKLPHI